LFRAAPSRCVAPRHGPLGQRQGKRASSAARMHPVATIGTRIFVPRQRNLKLCSGLVLWSLCPASPLWDYSRLDRGTESRSSWVAAALFYCRQSWRNMAMAGTVTIASVRAHGVRQLLVYCFGKREGDWPCHHLGKLPIDPFQAEEVLSDIERRCRCTVCGWRRADLRPDYSKQQAARQSVGWMMPP
jgi:hypothetical protein